VGVILSKDAVRLASCINDWSMMLRYRMIALPLVLLCGVAGTTRQAETGKFVLSQGGQQVGTEQYTRTATSIEGEMRVVSGQRIRYTARLADGIVKQMRLEAFAAADTTKPSQTAVVQFTADSLRLETVRNGEPVVERLAAPAGTVPYLNRSAVWMEEMLRRAKATGAATISVAVLSSPQQVGMVSVTFNGATEAAMTLGDTEIRFKLDERGRILAGDAPAQSFTFVRQ
jgi:hypothetical protein